MSAGRAISKAAKKLSTGYQQVIHKVIHNISA